MEARKSRVKVGGDEWLRDWERTKRAKKRFTSTVRHSLRVAGIYELRNTFPNNGRTVIHSSTRPGVVWQVTWLDDMGPAGHSDQQSVEGAALRAWEDAHPVERARFEA